ncbi:MAG: 2-oxo-4-hydroxy-4-carboxy-5-ureidoimidazoline decarboxylase [Planctomycetota bacterium]
MSAGPLAELAPDQARAALTRCCGSSRWVDRMLQRNDLGSPAAVFAAAEEEAEALEADDWLEAFSHHPKIGGADALREKFAATRTWSKGEQQGAIGADPEILQRLADRNHEYHEKFGFIFIVCATGKSAEEMLALLEARLPNDNPTELANAAAEQRKITRLRMEKLMSESKSEAQETCTLSTHVLDTARGGPANGLPITLEALRDGSFTEIGRAVTNDDGRAPELLPNGNALPRGTYRITFDTDTYFSSRELEGFYPYAQVVFRLANAGEHYHVPLLVSPYGYTTYRGS